MSTPGFFITGTGTGVGKTFVTARLAERARAAGQRVLAWKPIETGCSYCDGSLLGDDQRLLAHAAGGWQKGELLALYCFERPLAPLAAAQLETRTIDLAAIDRAFARGRANADLVLVEGAGGWRVPITETADMSSLAVRLGLPVIIVGSAGLGTINHTLLTVEAVERDGCLIDRVVLSRQDDVDPWFAEANAAEIRRRWTGRVVLSDAL